MKYCMYCGSRLEDDDLFCANCGRKTTEQGNVFNAGGFLKTLILVILPVISAAMLFLGWISFGGSQAGNLSAIISSCAGYTDNRVIQALGDGSLSPMELPKMADSIREISSFLAITNDTESLLLIENVFRVLGMAAILALAFAAIAIVFRTVRPLRSARNLDFGLFFLQLLLLVSFVIISIKINSYIEANAARVSVFSGLDTIRMGVTPWGIVACVCAVPSCLIDLIRFPGEKRKRERSALPVITAIGSVVFASVIIIATAMVFNARNSRIQAKAEETTAITAQTGAAWEQTQAESIQIESSEAAETQTEHAAETSESTAPGGLRLSQAFAEHMPITVFAAPLSGSRYVYAYTDDSLSSIDSSSFIDCDEDELVIVDMSADGKAVQVKYPILNGAYKTRWFNTEDILGNVTDSVESYVAANDARSFNISSSGNLSEQGYIGAGEEGVVIGSRMIGGTEYEITIYPVEPHTVNEVNNVSYRIAWILKDSYR